MKKKELWDTKVAINFRFPEGKSELVKSHAFKTMGHAFRCWRSDLNTKYIQKGLTPFHEFGKITQSQWETLVAEKTSPEALALSKRNSEQAKQNKHPLVLAPVATRASERCLGRWMKRPKLLGIQK